MIIIIHLVPVKVRIQCWSSEQSTNHLSVW